eukprot:3380084-Amphidinium_carterae.1
MGVGDDLDAGIVDTAMCSRISSPPLCSSLSCASLPVSLLKQNVKEFQQVGGRRVASETEYKEVALDKMGAGNDMDAGITDFASCSRTSSPPFSSSLP